MFGLFKSKKEEPQKEEGWVTRHKNKAKQYAESHKAGTRVAAQSKDGTWKEGVIIGEHDWALFTFFFVVKFDDGEIIKENFIRFYSPQEQQTAPVKGVEPESTVESNETGKEGNKETPPQQTNSSDDGL